MHVDYEPLVGLVRVYEDGNGRENHDPYVVCLTLRMTDETTAELMGLDARLTLRMWTALRNWLLDTTQVRVDRMVYRRGNRVKVITREQAERDRRSEAERMERLRNGRDNRQ